MLGLRRQNWQKIGTVVIAIVLAGSIADWSVRYFAYRERLKAAELAVMQFARQWDNFLEFTARSVAFQQTFGIYKPLLDPKQRASFLRQSSNWLEEIRKSSLADFWVLTDLMGKIALSLPLDSEEPSLRPIWEAPFKRYPCKASLFADAKGEPAFFGVGTSLLISGKKQGEIWLIYRLDSLPQPLSTTSLPASFYLVALKGDVVVRISQRKLESSEKSVYFTAQLNELPMLVTASVSKSTLVEDVGLLRLLVWDLLILGILISLWFVKIYRQVPGGELAVKLTEIFHALSERFLETGDSEKMFQTLAEAIVREFRFSIAIVFRFDKRTKNYIAAGYAPTHILREILSETESELDKKPKLVLPSSVIERIKDGKFCEGKDCFEEGCFKAITSLYPKEFQVSLQTMLRLQNQRCALLFAEGKPIGALIVGTSQERFSEEELQALELVRQQSAMLLRMVLSWEEQSEAERRASRFQEALLRLTKELPQKQNLTTKLQLVAQEVRNVLEISRVNIWQLTPDSQYACCVAAFGDDSENLIGTVLPISHYFTYLASLEEGRVIAASSVRDDPRTKELVGDYWLPHEIEATMDASIRVEGKVVGILCCEHKSKRNWNSDEIAFAGSSADLVAQVILESQRQRRERYLSTLSQITLQMLVSTEWESVLPIFLEDMGKVADADRAFVAQIINNEEGNETLKCLNVWSIDGNVERDGEWLLREVGAPYQIEAMRMGKPIFSIVKTLPEPYRQFYEVRGIKAILALPIFVESRWWGVLGFSVRSKEQHWDEVDIAILRIAASLIGSVIERQKAIERQIEQERQFRELVENANVGIYRSTPNGYLLMANPALAHMLGYETPKEAIAAITDLASQVYANPTHREDFKRMIAERGFVQNFIVPLRRRNGEIFWAAVSGRAVYDTKGNLLYYEGFILDITARKKAEEQLNRKLEQLQALYHFSSAVHQLDDLNEIALEVLQCLKSVFKGDKVAVFWVESDGKMRIKASDGFSERLKCAIEEFFAQSEIGFAISPICVNDLETMPQIGQLQSVLMEEGVKSVLCAPIVNQGKVLGRVSVYFNQKNNFEDGEVELLQTIAHQLSFLIARKIAEEQLRRSEREFRSIFENAVVGIYRSTLEGRFLIANKTFARINGYDSVEELMALDTSSQVNLNHEEREKFKRLMFEKGFVANYRYPIKRKDGSTGWVAEWARAVKDENGNILYYEGFALDITEQVQLEQRLRALQETARLLVMKLEIESVVQVAINAVSQLYPNSAVLIFRYQEDEDKFALEGTNENANDLIRILRLEIGSNLKRWGFPILEEKIWSGESILVNDIAFSVGSSVQKLAQLGYQAIFARGIGDSSQLWGIIVICQKGEKFSETDSLFLNSFCDYLSIAVRNALLFQQVRQAYDEMRGIQERMIEQERLRALGQIASGIAHDINNALVPIQGFAEILLEHSDPVVKDAAEMIFKSANDITTTVQRMREFYKVRSSEEVLETVNLNAICEDALRMTKPKWFNMPLEQGIVIEAKLELAEDLPSLTGISSEIRQAIVNLIINAVDAMPKGGTLKIRTYKQEIGGRAWAVIEVSDTGIGMDEETKRRAVEPFFTTKGEKGSGLGLAVVYGTIQRHEGFMEIDSEPGKGTTVRLWFPSALVQTVELPPGRIPSLKLLVIDDEPSVRETIALLLRKDGHVVVTAANGEEGLEIFQNAYLQGNPFNVVITDLGMPRMDGITVAKKIKEILPEVPVILLSGWGFRIKDGEVRSIIELVLNKPANYQQIRRALSQVWLGRVGSQV